MRSRYDPALLSHLTLDEDQLRPPSLLIREFHSRSLVLFPAPRPAVVVRILGRSAFLGTVEGGHGVAVGIRDGWILARTRVSLFLFGLCGGAFGAGRFDAFCPFLRRDFHAA